MRDALLQGASLRWGAPFLFALLRGEDGAWHGLTLNSKFSINWIFQISDITDKDEISKIRRAAISDARNSTGASGKRTRITISDGEWTAIQSGAISDTTLSEILRYAEPKTVRERATPRRTTQLSDARISRIKAMANSGHTNAEIAEALGISTSAVSKYLNS